MVWAKYSSYEALDPLELYTGLDNDERAPVFGVGR